MGPRLPPPCAGAPPCGSHSGLVIGRSGKNCHGAVDLFREHRANQPVRPGLNPKGERLRRRSAYLGRVSFRPADQETGFAFAIIAPAGKALRQCVRCQIIAAFIKADDPTTGRKARKEASAFGVKSAGAGDVRFLRAPSAECAGQASSPADIIVCEIALRPVLQTADPEDQKAHASGRAGAMGGLVRRPDLFKIIEFPHFRAEQMDDHVPGIDQHPVGIRHAFDTGGAPGEFLDFLRDAVCKRCHMAARTARCDNHEVGQGGLALKVNEDQILGLVVLKDF